MSEKNTEQQNIGRVMILGMWVVGLALSVVLVNHWLERSRNPNNAVVTSQEGGKRSITLKRGNHGHYIVTGSINQSTIDFLVDTGASSVSIPAVFADSIGLKRGAEILISTANGISTAWETRIDSLRIGELEVRNASAHINPGLTHEVLLGMSVLKQYELVQRGDTLVIREP